MRCGCNFSPPPVLVEDPTENKKAPHPGWVGGFLIWRELTRASPDRARQRLPQRESPPMTAQGHGGLATTADSALLRMTPLAETGSGSATARVPLLVPRSHCPASRCSPFADQPDFLTGLVAERGVSRAIGNHAPARRQIGRRARPSALAQLTVATDARQRIGRIGALLARDRMLTSLAATRPRRGQPDRGGE